MEEPASHSPYSKSLSLYHILHTSQNRQIKIFINFLTFRSECIMHNASMIEKKKQAAPIMLSWSTAKLALPL
jgi:hypothetical protein